MSKTGRNEAGKAAVARRWFKVRRSRKTENNEWRETSGQRRVPDRSLRRCVQNYIHQRDIHHTPHAPKNTLNDVRDFLDINISPPLLLLPGRQCLCLGKGDRTGTVSRK